METKYLDLSDNNASVDLEQVKKDGYRGVILKASEGATVTDPTFSARYKEAKDVGLERGAYCFARPETSSALEEAQHFVEIVHASGGFDVWPELGNRIPAILDLEDAGGLDETKLREYALTWLQEVEKLTGYKGGLYTGESFCNQYHLEVVQEAGYFLWIAAYSSTMPDMKEIMWQHTDTAHVEGITGNVDEDILTNTTADTPEMWHRVIGGDTLWEIAWKYHTSVPAILHLNPGIINENHIFVGQEIKVK